MLTPFRTEPYLDFSDPKHQAGMKEAFVALRKRAGTPNRLFINGKWVAAKEQFVSLDVPFLIDERKERITGLRTLMGRADVTTAEKFRQIMEAYQVENEYGRTIEAYRSTIDIEGRETTVDFLRYGRIALVYQSLDEQQQGAWSQADRKFVPLDSGYRSALRAGLRIARKQAAPDLIRLPLPAPTDAREAS